MYTAVLFSSDELLKILTERPELLGSMLDKMIHEDQFLVNMMMFYGVTDLATLSRLNLRFLLEGKHLCYKCKKEIDRFSQKFSVSSVRKFNFKLPQGMTTRDDICTDYFNKLPPAPNR